MQFDWQIVVTLLIVAACAFYLLRNIFSVFSTSQSDKPTSCGSCSQSESPNKAKITPIVELSSKSEENSIKAED